MALRVDLELAHASLELEALLAQVSDQVARDREIHRSHDVDVGPAPHGHHDEAEIEDQVDGRHQHGLSEPGAEACGQHGEREERIRRARQALGHGGDDDGECDVDPHRPCHERRRERTGVTRREVDEDAVRQMRAHDGEESGVDGERAARPVDPPGHERHLGIDVDGGDRRDREDDAATREVALYLTFDRRHSPGTSVRIRRDHTARGTRAQRP